MVFALKSAFDIFLFFYCAPGRLKPPVRRSAAARGEYLFTPVSRPRFVSWGIDHHTRIVLFHLQVADGML